MSDQPETMLEYHFRKLARVVVGTGCLIIVSLFAAAGMVEIHSNPGIGTGLLAGSAWLLLMSYAMFNEGRAREFFNYIYDSDYTGLERPDEPPRSEVVADD
jgi:hypothetical protein